MDRQRGLTAPQNRFLESIVAQSNGLNHAFILGNAHAEPYPIVYCSDEFILLTRYTRSSLMSQSSLCPFLWGPSTDAKICTELLHAFQQQIDHKMITTLYKQTGESFSCEVTVTPITNDSGRVVLFLCVYRPLPGSTDALQLDHRLAQSIGNLNHIDQLTGTKGLSRRSHDIILELDEHSRKRQNPQFANASKNLINQQRSSSETWNADCIKLPIDKLRRQFPPNKTRCCSLAIVHGKDCGMSVMGNARSEVILHHTEDKPPDHHQRLANDETRNGENVANCTRNASFVKRLFREQSSPVVVKSASLQETATKQNNLKNICGFSNSNIKQWSGDFGRNEEVLFEYIGGHIQDECADCSPSENSLEESSASPIAKIPSSKDNRLRRLLSKCFRTRCHGNCDDSDTNDDDESRPDPSTYKYRRRKSFAAFNSPFPLTRRREQKHKKINQKLNKFSGKKVPEYKMQPFVKPTWVLLHYGWFRIIWDWILLLCTFYIAFMVPYNAAFTNRAGWIDLKRRMVDLFIEILLIIDILFNFNTTYVNQNGQLVCNRYRLAMHYLRGSFWIDLLAALPVDFILVVTQLAHGEVVVDQHANSTVKNTSLEFQWGSTTQTPQMRHPMFTWETISLLHMLKLTRLLRLARLFQNITRISQHGIVVLGLLMFTFTLVAHWFACIWYLIGYNEMWETNSSWIQEVAHRLNLSISKNDENYLDVTTSYFSALYFTCSSLTSVGFGNVSANTTKEKIFAICIMLLGALMHAAIFGNVTAIIQRLYARLTAFQTKTQDLKDFVRLHRVPKPLKRRMEDFFQTMWAINRGINVSEVLNVFPDELKRDIALHLNHDLLSLKIFQNASQDCLKNLAVKIKSTFFTPGEYLIHSGDVLRRLYFVCNGSLEILENEEVVALLGKNDFFGTYIDTTIERGKIVRSRCDVKSLTYCDLQSIELTVLNEVLDQYPRFKSEFVAYLYEDLSFNIQEGARMFYTPNAIEIPAITLEHSRRDSNQLSLHSRTVTPDPTISSQRIAHTASIETDLEAGNKSVKYHTPQDGMRYYPRKASVTKTLARNKHLRKSAWGVIGSKLDLYTKANWMKRLKSEVLKQHRDGISVPQRRHTLPKTQERDDDVTSNSAVGEHSNNDFDGRSTSNEIYCEKFPVNVQHESFEEASQANVLPPLETNQSEISPQSIQISHNVKHDTRTRTEDSCPVRHVACQCQTGDLVQDLQNEIRQSRLELEQLTQQVNLVYQLLKCQQTSDNDRTCRL